MNAPLGSVGIAVGSASAVAAVATSAPAGPPGPSSPTTSVITRTVRGSDGQTVTAAVVAVEGDRMWLGERALLRGLAHPEHAPSDGEPPADHPVPTVFAGLDALTTTHDATAAVPGGPAASGRAALSALLVDLVIDAPKGFTPGGVTSGEPLGAAAIAVPSAYDDDRRRIIGEAAVAAGLGRPLLVDEVVAGALGAGADTRTGPILLVDVGARRCTVGLLERGGPDGLQPRRVVVDAGLGGRDLDRLITDWAVQTAALRSGGSLAGIDRVRLGARVIQAKQLLARSAVAPLYVVGAERTERLLLDRDLLERLADPLLSRLAVLIRTVLADAPAAPCQVLLIGGSSRLPMIGRLVEQVTGRVPVQPTDPQAAVAHGAAMIAARWRVRPTATGGEPSADPFPSRSDCSGPRSAERTVDHGPGSAAAVRRGRRDGRLPSSVSGGRPRLHDTVVVSAGGGSGPGSTRLHPLRPGQRELRVEVVGDDGLGHASHRILGSARVALQEGGPTRGPAAVVRLQVCTDPDGIVSVQISDEASGRPLGEFELDRRAGEERRETEALLRALAAFGESDSDQRVPLPTPEPWRRAGARSTRDAAGAGHAGRLRRDSFDAPSAGVGAAGPDAPGAVAEAGEAVASPLVPSPDRPIDRRSVSGGPDLVRPRSRHRRLVTSPGRLDVDQIAE